MSSQTYDETFIDDNLIIRYYLMDCKDEDIEPFSNFLKGDIVYLKKYVDAYSGGKKEGYVLHRADGPALIQSNGKQYWLKDGELHRLNGPAVFYPLGEVQNKFFLHGKLHADEELYWIKCLNE